MNIIPAMFESTSTEGYTLRIQSSMILIAVLCLIAAQADAALAPPACCGARGQVGALRTLVRALARVANLLLGYAAIITRLTPTLFQENSSLIQIYVWYTLAFIVLGFVVAILDMLLGVKHQERWCIANFVSEIVFLFVLSRCLPLVDMYRKQINEQNQAKYSD